MNSQTRGEAKYIAEPLSISAQTGLRSRQSWFGIAAAALLAFTITSEINAQILPTPN